MPTANTRFGVTAAGRWSLHLLFAVVFRFRLDVGYLAFSYYHQHLMINLALAAGRKEHEMPPQLQALFVSRNFRQLTRHNRQTIKFEQMEQKEYTKMTDQELLDEAKKMKSFSITNALLIGFLAGVIVFSFVKSSWGMLTLIPLYFIYKMVNDPKNKKVKELQNLFKKRNLKW